MNSQETLAPQTPADLFYLSSADILRLQVGVSDVLDAVERMFLEKAAGRLEMPPKPGIHPTETGFIHAMPAYVPAMRAAGMKWVAAYPENAGTGIPQVSGLIVVNDSSTGLPTAILDSGWVTAMRTAAASALAARHLARSDSEVLGILGCGVQGRSHVEAFIHLFPLRQVIAYDPNPGAITRFANDISRRHSIEVLPVDTPKDAIASSDMVVTAGPITKPPHATIPSGWLRPGAFASSVDFASYWSKDALVEFDRLCTDDLTQFEAYRDHGYFPGFPAGTVELAQLIAGTTPGRRSAEERSFACNLGIAAEDVVVAQLLLERAQTLDLGTRLPR